MRGSNHGIVEHPRQVLARYGLTLDLAATLDAALYQVSHGETDISFERIDTGRLQSITH